MVWQPTTAVTKYALSYCMEIKQANVGPGLLVLFVENIHPFPEPTKSLLGI